MSAGLVVKRLGRVDYAPAWEAMQHFTTTRNDATDDEIWLLEHPPVYTLGRASRDGHLLHADDIPVVQSDRGGQITYHGPGQLIGYTLIDIARLGLGIKPFVATLEQAVIDLLADLSIIAARRAGAPGVYVDGEKIAALGLRVRRGRSYHGLSLNVAMDLAPFAGIDPCGYPGLGVTQVRDLAPEIGDDPAQLIEKTGNLLAGRLTAAFGYARMDTLS